MRGVVLLMAVAATGQAQKAARDGVAVRDELGRAAQALVVGDRAEARLALDHVLIAEPRNARALNLKGVLEAMEGNAQQAELLFREAVRAEPKLGAAHANLARSLRQQERLDQAVDEFKLALEDGERGAALETEFLDTLEELVLAQRRAGDQQAALVALVAARRLLPGNPRALFDFGQQAMGMGFKADGVEALRQAHAAESGNENYLYGLAHAEQSIGHAAAADPLFRAYLKAHPEDASAHFGLGLALLDENRDEEAGTEFAASVRLRPEQSESYYQLGRLAEENGDAVRAREQYETALRYDAQHAGAATNLGAILLKAKDYEGALKLLRGAVEAAPDYAPAHLQLGLTLARIGQQDESRKELDRARELTAEADKKKVERPRLVLDPAGTRR